MLVVATTTWFATALSSTGCGSVLHPERRGHAGGAIYTPTQTAQLELRLITSEHHVVARNTAVVGPRFREQTVELRVAASARPSPDTKIYLDVVGANGASARFPTAMKMK